jgi:hypothetical protein
MPTLAAPRMLAIGGGYTRPTIRFRVSKMKLIPPEIRAVIALAVGMFCVQVDFFALSLALPRWPSTSMRQRRTCNGCSVPT